MGDAQYGGAIPQEKEGKVKSTQYVHSDQLALQCSQLEFLDPNVIVKNDGTEVLVPSDRWNIFQLNECWWTPLIEKYQAQCSTNDDVATTSVTRYWSRVGHARKRVDRNKRMNVRLNLTTCSPLGFSSRQELTSTLWSRQHVPQKIESNGLSRVLLHPNAVGHTTQMLPKTL